MRYVLFVCIDNPSGRSLAASRAIRDEIEARVMDLAREILKARSAATV